MYTKGEKLMKTYLVIIRSRAELMSFIDVARSYGVAATLSPLPKEAKSGCGLCASINERDLSKSYKIISYYKYASFYGIYLFDRGRKKIKRVY